MTNNPCNPSNKLRLYCNTCTHHHGETPFLCFHPDYIGRDGDGVSLTAMEQEFVKRMGCANHPDVREHLMRNVISYLEQYLIDENNKPFDRYEWCNRAQSAMAKEAIALIRGEVK